MDRLLFSRKQKHEEVSKLESISPEKYGKGAYCQLTYTPSKLADNVLFREASSLKRIEEESSKVREYESQNQLLSDQVQYLKRQRDGISDSLNQMINMYKKIVSEMEVKNEERSKEMQRRLSEEMQKLIATKEEEAKYFQSEREFLEQKIQELENANAQLTLQLNEALKSRGDLSVQLDKANLQIKHLEQRLKDTVEKAESQQQRLKNQLDESKKQFMNAEIEWKNQLRDQIHKKDKEIQNNQRSHKAEIQKLENIRATQALLKNQELNELAKVFETESKRLSDIIGNKDRTIDTLSHENNKEKARILTLTRDYEAEINHLTHEKNRCLDEIDLISKENEMFARDKNLLASDLERQNLHLRDLLMESSIELQKCKNQFVALGKQNAHLAHRLRSCEDEAKTWRDSYYLNKSRPL